ncbi:polysaccharide deacetylase family protein, partial [Bacillus cereus]
FFTFFLIGKWNSIPAKGVANENIRLANTQEQGKKEDTLLAKQKRADGKPVGKVVYLTFDDGPSELTGKFLDVLKEQHVASTFFMQGSNLQNTGFQENVKRAVKEGHYIGAHSMTHNSDKLYKKGQFVTEMKETLALIHNITGTTPKLVRPPYGSAPGLKGQDIRNKIVEAGIKVWDWTIDSNDWKLKGNPQQIIENVKRTTTEDVEVVLMHEKLQTLQALPEIIKFYKEKGYEFGVYNEADHFQLNFQKDQRL